MKVNNIRGGRRLRYTKMKQVLLTYRMQKIGGRSYWRKELAASLPEEEESYDIYRLRLTELANRAYPSDTKECAFHLRECFLRTLPSQIRNKILDTELAQRATSRGSKRYLPFATLTQLAKDIQSVPQKVKTVMWASEPSRRSPPLQLGYYSRSSLPNNSNTGQRSREFRLK